MGIKVFPGASPSAQAGGQLQETGLQTKWRIFWLELQSFNWD